MHPLPHRNEFLYDVMTLLTLMMGALASYHANALAPAMRRIDTEMRGLLGQLRSENLGEMTKSELNAFLRDVRTTATALLAQIPNDSTERLKVFADTGLRTSALVLAAEDMQVPVITPEEIVERADERPMNDGNERRQLWLLWLMATVRAYEQGVRAAHASNGTRADVEESWGNAWSRAWIQSVGIDTTSSAHIGTQVFLDLIGSGFEFYVWCSIIDSRTSDTCRRLNNRVFRMGAGPVPPAHFYCRSHITPVVGDGADVPSETLHEWFSRQPRAIQHVVIPSRVRRGIDVQDLTADELRRLVKTATLNPDELLRQFERGLRYYETET